MKVLGESSRLVHLKHIQFLCYMHIYSLENCL